MQGLQAISADAGEPWPPTLRISSLNCGLTNDHVTFPNPYIHTFTTALQTDLKEIFRDQGCHGLFLCELGSQKSSQNIDQCFKERNIQFCRPKTMIVDTSSSLKEYLVSLLKLHGLTHLEVLSLPPYAYIGNPNILSVKSPEAFHPLPEDQERRAVHYDMVFKPTGDKISVVCIHSPSSAEWSPLSTARKKIIFETCMERAGGGFSNSSKKWIICGNLNSDKGSLNWWKQAYETEQSIISIHQAREESNRPSDYMLSSGFMSEHVESTIGASFNNRQHASDAHDLLTLHGIPIVAPDPPAH